MPQHHYTRLELSLGLAIVLLLLLLVGSSDFVDAVKSENDSLRASLTRAKACEIVARRIP